MVSGAQPRHFLWVGPLQQGYCRVALLAYYVQSMKYCRHWLWHWQTANLQHWVKVSPPINRWLMSSFGQSWDNESVITCLVLRMRLQARFVSEKPKSCPPITPQQAYNTIAAVSGAAVSLNSCKVYNLIAARAMERDSRGWEIGVCQPADLTTTSTRYFDSGIQHFEGMIVASCDKAFSTEAWSPAEARGETSGQL